MFDTYLEIQQDKLDTEKLNLDGTHSLVKKSAESSKYQYRKTKKRGKKRFYHDEVYKTRFVNMRCFAWIDSFKTLLIRFDKLDKHRLNWHYLAFALIVMKV
ncbi:MAG: hypothetical protein LBE36_03765 [Flavobacteriaceae bacterium]|jgi:transposase|nr:hypothetical protein [Flavobacteriaceae bacterium]